MIVLCARTSTPASASTSPLNCNYQHSTTRIHCATGTALSDRLSDQQIFTVQQYFKMAPLTAAQPMYGKDEKVLCFHHELLYEAKVLEAKIKDPNDKKEGYMYRVHYKGWKNT